MSWLCEYFVLIIFVFMVFVGCLNRNTDNALLAKQVDSIEKKIQLLKPGLADLMAGIQTHHSKLFFAGSNENWVLAGYQLEELEEGLERAVELHENYKGVKSSLKNLKKVIEPSIENLERAIKEKRSVLFKKGFGNLTESCNQCHRAADREFIVIQVPEFSGLSNQNFKPMPNSSN